MSTELNIESSAIYEANRRALYDKDFKIACNQGGTRSGKTYNIIILLITICLNPVFFGYKPDEHISVSIVSQSLPHLKKGAIRDFLKILRENNLYDDKSYNKTNHVYTFGNGNYIEFASFETEDAARGPGRKILYVNEANSISFEIFWQLLLRTEHKVLIDYNPVDLYSWIYDKVRTREDCKFIQSTYLDNWDFLNESQRTEIENLKTLGGDFWKIYGLGEVGSGEGRIYSNWKRFDKYPDKIDETIYGLDFGYNHPMSLTRIQFSDGIPYIDSMVYQSGLITSDLIRIMNEQGISKSDYIYCDNAEPDRIEEITKAGYNAHPAMKDVDAGIDYCKKLNLNIHSSAVDLIKEIQMYQYKKDKNGRLLDEPIKAFDDGMDSMRYGLYTHSKQTEMNIWIM